MRKDSFCHAICRCHIMNIFRHNKSKAITIFIIAFFVDISLQQSWAKSVSRGPSSVETLDEASAEDVEEANDFTDEVSAPAKSDFQNTNKSGVQNLVVTGSLQFKAKQSFEDAYIELLTEEGSDLYEAGQPLTRDFDNAYVARQRINYCSRFIARDGNYGEWGQLIDASFSQYSELRTALLSSATANAAGMRNVCPRFSSLTNAEKREFWVWVMASLALYESTCGFDTSNSVNSNAVGIYQLHRSTTDRLPRSLIANQRCGRLVATEVAKPRENILCTLDFIRDAFSGRMDHAPAGLITKAQQFQKLRTENTSLVKLIKKFQLCHPPRQRPVS